MVKFVTLEQTCEYCPEQYWARIESSHIIGYIRLRSGHLSCDYLTTGNFEGDRIRLVDHHFDDEYKGEFDSDEERKYWLDKCKAELLDKYNELQTHPKATRVHKTNTTMEENVKPIKPSEVSQYIPNWIIKGANECINANYKELKRQSHFTQDELIEYCLKYAPEGVTRKAIFDNCWLDIEPIYRREGWIVEYDKPAYYENYDANFTFKLPK